jgi:hypothetical protein
MYGLVFMSIRRDCVSELRPLMGQLFIAQMIYEYRWNDIDRGNPNNMEKNLSQCHFVHRKFHMD